MLSSRHALTFAAAALALSSLPACAATPSTKPAKAAPQDSRSGLALDVPPCDALAASATTALEADTQCAAGDKMACFEASVHYACGSGVAPDPRKAAQRAAQACKAGHAPSCAQAGALYMTSADAEDVATAVHHLRAGCSGNDGEACNNLAVAMSEGRGVPEDTRGALFMFDRLCKSQVSGACANAAIVRDNIRRDTARLYPPCEGDQPCVSVVVARSARR